MNFQKNEKWSEEVRKHEEHLLLCSTCTIQSDLEQSQTTTCEQVPETGRNRMELVLLLGPQTVLQKIQLLKMSRVPQFSTLRRVM